jgi:hypothetical protein
MISDCTRLVVNRVSILPTEDIPELSEQQSSTQKPSQRYRGIYWSSFDSPQHGHSKQHSVPDDQHQCDQTASIRNGSPSHAGRESAIVLKSDRIS